ncbi:hypothetical protein D0869_02051 [Hortaea werneckii]|uniref:Uncharacterized protein n=1 Tax=Hortaea werneckii TaxID=91943 RepID=A0A3M6XBD8_HORWE|nr:hypothetical protein KC324_g10038 [Hortaea werneckii]KAI7578052.1 hypothetical protein KC316_g10040 [Hortaea werneckii]RMX87846.1 hypothetical protein D0869_02051 [Hortaea werneckii]RMY06440.1 hypothetical protein D0868_05864 [Hortaea werneckii]
MVFRSMVDSLPMSPSGPPYSLFLSSVLDSVFADENGSRSVTQAQLANVFRFQDLADVADNNNRLRFMPDKSGGGGNWFQVITHGLAYEAQWRHWDDRYHQLYTLLPWTRATRTEIALAHTNIQLYYSDALSIFYAYTRFHFGTLKEIRTFIANVPVHCRNKIRDISFRYSYKHRGDAQVALFELEEWRGIRKYDRGVKYEGVRLLLLLNNLKELRLEGDASRLTAYFAKYMTSEDRRFKIVNSGRRVRWRNGVAFMARGTAQTKSRRAQASKDGDLHA